MGLFDFLRRSRAGEPYDGVIVRCNDPALVPWPGWYGVDANDQPDPSCQVEGNFADGWKRVK